MAKSLCGHLNITPICGHSISCCHKHGSAQLSKMCLYAAALQFTSLELRGPNLIQDKRPAQNPDQNPTEDVWDELEHKLHPRHPHSTSVSLNSHSHATKPSEGLPRRIKVNYNSKGGGGGGKLYINASDCGTDTYRLGDRIRLAIVYI